MSHPDKSIVSGNTEELDEEAAGVSSMYVFYGCVFFQSAGVRCNQVSRHRFLSEPVIFFISCSMRQKKKKLPLTRPEFLEASFQWNRGEGQSVV